MGAAGQRVSAILWQTAFITRLGLVIVVVSVLISVGSAAAWSANSATWS